MVSHRRDVGRGIIIGAAVLAFFSHAVQAQTPFERVETRVLTAAFFPRGVRNIGMGGAGASDIMGFTTGYYNPASFAWCQMLTLGTGINDWSSHLTFTDTRISGGRRWLSGEDQGGWMVGGSIGYSTMSAEVDWMRTIYLPEGQAEGIDDTDYYVSGACAGGFRAGIWEMGVGVTTKYLDANTVLDYSLWAFDLGVIISADIFRSSDYTVRPRVGASVSNLGESIEFGASSIAEQPGAERVGFGLDLGTPSNEMLTDALRRRVAILGVSVDFDLVSGTGSNNEDGWAFGMEASILEMLQLRFGACEEVFPGERFNTFGIGLGWDFGRIMVQLDYARIDPQAHWFIFDSEDAYGIVIGGVL
ncbi:MAG: hypothetical protein JSV33_14860 [bacterium]|nr:MAG: hypothetical protein JSV33_14860 [bacterium]